VNLFAFGGDSEMRPGEARLPWDDPTFGARMLAEHLDQRHDLASRRRAVIAEHVAWLRTIGVDPGRVLDLGCGPGLYLEELAAAGWECVGVDVSPASIEYARQHAPGEYVRGDFTTMSIDESFDLVLCLFGELSTVGIDAASRVLTEVARRLRPNARAVIELSTLLGVQGKGQRPPGWYRAVGGLFADGRHLVLQERRWFESESASVERWWVIRESDPTPQMYGSTTWSYERELDSAIADAGLAVEGRYGDLTGAPCAPTDEFETLVLRIA
jgi:SAM-dependent methyltransferase